MFRIALLMAGVLALTCTLIRPVFAVESGKGFYLLGSKTNLAGILPPEGVYFANPIWFLLTYFFLFLEFLFFELHQYSYAFSISKAGREHKRDEQTISTTLSSLSNTRDKSVWTVWVGNIEEMAENQRAVVVDRDTLLTFMQYRSKAFNNQRFGQLLDTMDEKERQRLIIDRGHSILQVARDLGIRDTALGRW